MRYQIKLFTRVKIDVTTESKAYANVICLGDRCKSFAKGFVENSQTRISLMGIVNGLEQIKEGAKVTIYTTNSYALNTYEKGWLKKWEQSGWLKGDGTPPLNVDLWKRLADQAKRHDISFVRVKKYRDYPELIEAKEIGATTLLQGNLQIDEVHRAYVEELNGYLELESNQTSFSNDKEDVVGEFELPLAVEKPFKLEELESNVVEKELILEDFEEEIEGDEEMEVEDDQSNSVPTKISSMPKGIKLLVRIKEVLHKYFTDAPLKAELRSTDLYDEIVRFRDLREEFPSPFAFNRFLRKQQQEGVLQQILNCNVDTTNKDFYQWFFRK